MFGPMYLSPSDVPHTQPDTVGRLHGNELRPFALRAVGDLNHSLACSLLAIDPRNLIPSQIDVGSGTIGRQVSIVDSRDCRALAKICGRTSIDRDLHNETGVVAR